MDFLNHFDIIVGTEDQFSIGAKIILTREIIKNKIYNTRDKYPDIPILEYSFHFLVLLSNKNRMKINFVPYNNLLVRTVIYNTYEHYKISYDNFKNWFKNERIRNAMDDIFDGYVLHLHNIIDENIKKILRFIKTKCPNLNTDALIYQDSYKIMFVYLFYEEFTMELNKNPRLFHIFVTEKFLEKTNSRDYKDLFKKIKKIEPIFFTENFTQIFDALPDSGIYKNMIECILSLDFYKNYKFDIQ